jgi:2-polyprenyl-6-methoxyphenol hydroxylase-like FAD-dependent oxidoreductase
MSEEEQPMRVQEGRPAELACDFVVGAAGFHGISRAHVPGLVEQQHAYPYAWLGIRAAAPPSCAEVIYARHARGFALHSMRSPQSPASTSRWRRTRTSRTGPTNASGPSCGCAQLQWIASAPAMATALAQNYTGLPYEQDWSYR